METSEILKMLEQMHRDKRSAEEIHTATARYREIAEAEEAAEDAKPKTMPRIGVNIGPMPKNIMRPVHC